MKKSRWLLLVGCGIPLIVLIALVIWMIVAYQINEIENEKANQEYQIRCNEKDMLVGENIYKWRKLETDVKSGRVDSRELSIHIEPHSGTYNKYAEILGNVENVSGIRRLFLQKIWVKYRGKAILVLNNTIVINELFFPDFLSMGFVKRSCYGDLQYFDSVINFHDY